KHRAGLLAAALALSTRGAGRRSLPATADDPFPGGGAARLRREPRGTIGRLVRQASDPATGRAVPDACVDHDLLLPAVLRWRDASPSVRMRPSVVRPAGPDRQPLDDNPRALYRHGRRWL